MGAFIETKKNQTILFLKNHTSFFQIQWGGGELTKTMQGIPELGQSYRQTKGYLTVTLVSECLSIFQ